MNCCHPIHTRGNHHVNHCHCRCTCHSEGVEFQRRFRSKDDEIKRLKDYAEELEKELKAVKERINYVKE